VGISTVDADYLLATVKTAYLGTSRPAFTSIKLGNRGFLAFACDGQYKYGRFMSAAVRPAATAPR
jgi:hypothetical protein